MQTKKDLNFYKDLHKTAIFKNVKMNGNLQFKWDKSHKADKTELKLTINPSTLTWDQTCFWLNMIIYELALLLWRWKRAHRYDLTLYDQYDQLTDSLGILSLFR